MQPQPVQPKKGLSHTARLGLFVAFGCIALVALAMASARQPPRQPVAAPVTQPTPTTGPGEFACQDFRALAGDVNAGVLTDAEIRAELQEVRKWAGLGTPAMQASATELLAASTSGDVPAMRAGFVSMDAACTEAGH